MQIKYDNSSSLDKYFFLMERNASSMQPLDRGSGSI